MELNQANLFYIFILTGILIGLLFDMFRILRKSFKTSDFVTYIEDMIFWILAGFLLFYTIYKFNNGEIRSYVLLGIVFGITVYMLLFSKIFIKVNVKIITFIKSIFMQFLQFALFPFKFICKMLKKIFFKPVSFIFINIRKNLTNIFTAISKIRPKFSKKPKKIEQKEGF